MSGRRGHGEGSVYQRASDGQWVGVLDLGWHEGRRRRRTVYGKSRREVLQKVAALRRSQEHGIDLLAKQRTVAEWLEEWLTEIKAHDGTRPTTLARYRQVVDTHLRPGLGRNRLEKLAPRDVQRFLASRRSALSAGSVAKVHAVLRSALSEAERMELVPRNVAKSVKPTPAETAERQFLTVEQGRHLLEVVKSDPLEGVFTVALTMGLRRGEVLGLKWSDIDVENRILRVERALQRYGGSLQLVQPKTVRSRRPLPTPALALAAFERQRTRQAANRLRAGPAWQDSGLVFTTEVGTAVEPRNVNRRFHRLRHEAGLDWLRLHDLRHGCATFLLAHGVEPRTVMEILGHSTFRLTMDLYGHVLPSSMKTAAEAMDRALGE